MRFEPRAVLFIFVFLFLASIPSCGRKPASLEALDYIDRRTNVPMVEPISRDLAQIRERGSLTVVAPYNSTTYFIYQGDLKWLQQYWAKRIEDENERLKFILASYNTGVGHVEDAQRLTEKYGGNREIWDDVAYWLLQKSTQQYSSDSVVKFGFCRGLEPVNYVSHILEQFEHYKQFVVA